MSDASFQRSWTDLLKASRNWQLQWDLKQLLSQVCRDARELLRFDLAALYLLEQSGVGEVARDGSTQAAEGVESQLDVAQDTIRSGRMTYLRAANAGRVVVCAPLMASREIVGALFLQSASANRAITESDNEFLEMFAQQAAACIKHARLYQSAITDPLTSLFCHRHFQQEVEQAVRRAMRNERPVSLLLMDLDHFKELNDTCGHDAGNKCLLQVADLLRNIFRATDVLARFGGDEFEILLPDTPPENAELVAQNLRRKICELQLPQGRKVSTTIGIAGFPLNAASAHTLFLCADAALYKAKEAGRNCVVTSTQKMDDDHVALIKDHRAQDSLSARRQYSSEESRAPTAAMGGTEMIDGHVVVRPLASGSTGEILLVIQPGLEREVALKRPLTRHPTSEQTQTFEEEAKVTAALNHPGIVPVHTMGRDHDNRRYYTMKPLGGRTLEEILESRRKGNMDVLHEYTTARLLEILQRVAEAIAYAHEQNVLHLDIRPANILVGNFGEVTVIDWASGSSQSRHKRSDSSSTLKLVGSPAYVAPELLRDAAANRGRPCDVFALGTLLYLLLTDALPFQRSTTAATIEALLKGDFLPPDVVSDAGLDPSLSNLCIEALSTDPSRRPDAKTFAQRLGKYIRHEADWTSFTFGPGAHPLRENEWTAYFGEWQLENDHFVHDTNEGVLVWNTPVPGSFRFTCEAWIEESGSELSIIGHRPAYGSHNYRNFGGYFFQVGAEVGSITKLARHDGDVMYQPAAPLVPGRRYVLEMQYQDREGLIHCALDGKRVFTYRELFPFPGSQIGLYAYGRRTHYRPLKLERQNWNQQIPALRAADRHYQFGHHQEALECYQEIAATSPGRSDALEATLKSGICYAALNKTAEAQQCFHALRGTAFEPFALAEEGIMDQYRDSQRSIQLFKTLMARFPTSQARLRVLDAAKHNFDYAREEVRGRSLMKDIAAKIEWNRLAAQCFDRPIAAQVSAMSHVYQLMTMIGKHNEALEELPDYERQISRFRETPPAPFRSAKYLLAVASGSYELLPDGFVLDEVSPEFGCLSVNCAVLKGNMDLWLQPENMAKLSDEDRIQLHLAAGNLSAVEQIIHKHVNSEMRKPLDEVLASALIGARQEPWVRNYIAKFCSTSFSQLGHARYYLEGGDLERASRALEEYTALSHVGPRNYYVWKVMLHSLGLKQSFDTDVHEHCERLLYGPMLELAKMFLGELDPKPTAHWPVPNWHPERRLWLGLWLEAKGQKAEAFDVVAPSRNPRFGFTNSQPAIEDLCRRVRGGV